LAIHQRIAVGKILRQAHQRLIDRDFAVRMELADDVADHASALLEGRARIEVQLAHGVEQPAVHGLQAVAHVRQRARGDGRKRVGEITLSQRFREIHVADGAGRCRRCRHLQRFHFQLFGA
jgi:hypothetical protein